MSDYAYRKKGPCNRETHTEDYGCWHKNCVLVQKFKDGSVFIRNQDGFARQQPIGTFLVVRV